MTSPCCASSFDNWRIRCRRIVKRKAKSCRTHYEHSQSPRLIVTESANRDRQVDRADLIKYFDALAPAREDWISRNWYYHEELARTLSFFIVADSSVLQIGSGTGALLNALQPKRGVGLDFSSEMVNVGRRTYPHLEFQVDDVENLKATEKFDYVILSDVIGFLNDVQRSFANLHQVCHRSTRILVTHFNFLWEPILQLSERFGWKAKQPLLNWLTPYDISNLLELAGFEMVRTVSRLLLPVHVPVLSALCNCFLVNLPVVKHLGLLQVMVARPRREGATRPLSCTVVIPCRNERGNIASAVDRLPDIGSHTEIIFVEGASTDGTKTEIERVIERHPNRDIKLLIQQGNGKGDAVRLGFAAARGELLLILDGDLSVDPEELPKFHDAIAKGAADFVQGSRLVYPMQDEAMRFLNLLGNRFFSIVFTYLLGQHLKDTLCGTKVLLRSDYERIATQRKYFGELDPFGDFDLIFGAAKLSLKILEIPIHYRVRSYGVTNIRRFQHGLLLLRMAWRAVWKMKFV
jgi:SAM-dependent methyltransferase